MSYQVFDPRQNLWLARASGDMNSGVPAKWGPLQEAAAFTEGDLAKVCRYWDYIHLCKAVPKVVQ